MNRRFAGGVSILVIVGIVVIVALVVVLSGQFFYFQKVDQQEVGVQFRGGQIYNVVGPGVYSDFGLFVEMYKISSQAIPFSLSDEEIITKDKQLIGVEVKGDIFRPNLAQKDILIQSWAKYRNVYLDDELARDRVEGLSKQAMKVCVGDRNFNDNIIGTARDALRACIDDELSKLATNYGLGIENVVVPNVLLSPAVQTALGAIVQSRLETEKAAQDELKAKAQSLAEQARQEGEIRVQQSRIQEETKQQTLLALLDRDKIMAQKAVIEAERANELAKVEANRAIIEAQKSNDLLSAQKDLEISKAQALAAAEKAKADLAAQAALAELYAKNPGYLQLQIALANASALKATDKVIFTPEGMVPTLVLPGPGIMPTVETGPAAPAATGN